MATVKLSKRDIWEGVIWTVLTFAPGFFLYKSIPDSVPIHFNFRWEPDLWADKQLAIWALPIIVLFVWMVLVLVNGLAWATARNKDQEKVLSTIRILNHARTGVTGFLVGVNAALVAYWVGELDSPARLVTILGGMLIFVSGILIQAVPRNPIIGIRLPWTLPSESVWRTTNYLAGRLLMAFGVFLMFVLIIPLWITPAVLLVILVGVCVYSYRLYKSDAGQLK